jgi:hypothetical protein
MTATRSQSEISTLRYGAAREGIPLKDFKTAAFDRSANSPA